MNESVYPCNQSDAAVQPSYGNILAAILGSLLIISTLIRNSLLCINFYLFKELRTVPLFRHKSQCSGHVGYFGSYAFLVCSAGHCKSMVI